MNINNIRVICNGYITCKSSFYSVLDVVNQETVYEFSKGINKITGEIDSGIWGISYLLSMYVYKQKDFVLNISQIEINNYSDTLDNVSNYACYLDKSYRMFSSKKCVRKLVENGLKKTGINKSPEEICKLFLIDPIRFERPLAQVGNEVFKAMAAIAYCNGKQIFCFPWMSKNKFDYYQNNLKGLLDTLKNLDLIVILPIGKE